MVAAGRRVGGSDIDLWGFVARDEATNHAAGEAAIRPATSADEVQRWRRAVAAVAFGNG